MKTLQFLLLILIISLNLNAQVDTSYYETGEIESIGNYELGLRNGEWKWFYPNGQLMSIEEYSFGSFKRGKFWNEQGEKVTVNEIMIQPQYANGGMNGFTQFISENLTYPTVALDKKIKGKVTVDFNINRNGEPVDFKIVQSLHEFLDSEAIRVIKSAGKWIPGSLHGEVVVVAMRIPVVFK